MNLTEREREILAALAWDEADARERHNREGNDFDLGEIAELYDLARRLRDKPESLIEQSKRY